MEQNGLILPNDSKEGKSFVLKSKILLARKSTKVGCFIESEGVSRSLDITNAPLSQFTIGEPCSLSSNNLENPILTDQNLESQTNPKILADIDSKNNVPTSVVAKIYDGTPISHPSPTTVNNKKRTRPKSAIEHQNNRLGLCCSLSERSLSPATLPSVSTERNSTNGVLTRPLGIPFGTRSLDKPEIIERGEAEIISFKESSFSSSSPLIHNSGATFIKVSPKTFHSKNNVSNSDSSCARMRKRLLSRRSADNLVTDLSDSPLQHSSPESTRSVPIDKTRSSSHDTLSHRGSASMDSLARQALLAAQVLHLIPTAKARERNFLQGRIAANSLLGPTELERVLPKREVRVFVGTWNMNGQTPPKELNDFVLPSNMAHVPDILAIGTQESCSERFEWEVCLQETIGPTHVLLHSASLGGFTCISGTLHLAIFIRRDLVWFCSLPEDGSMSVRTGSAFRTKGAVAVAFSLFGTTYLFVTAHLTAHQEKVKERVSDIKRIIRALDLPKHLPIRHKNKDVTQNFDCVFWCGDLNFRLGEPRDKVLQWINSTTFPLPSHLPHGYMHSDQLAAVLADGAAFKGFQEAQITFPPTYKYDPGTQRFDTSSKQRAPAYTDRILYKSRPVLGGGHGLRRNSGTPALIERPQLECLAYDSVPSLITSDHKPVWALFKNIVRPGIDTIPLAAGLFNREVYLEGVKRRAATLELSRGASGVCSIQ